MSDTKKFAINVMCKSCGERNDITEWACLEHATKAVNEANKKLGDAVEMVLDGWGKYDGSFGVAMRSLRAAHRELERANAYQVTTARKALASKSATSTTPSSD